MNERAYAVARLVAPRLHAHFSSYQELDRARGAVAVDTIPDVAAIEAMIDTVFWASLRREEGYVPKISLAFLTPTDTDHPLVFEQSLPLDAAVLTRVSPAVERPGIHLGVHYVNGALCVWGTARTIPPHSFVVEVVEPGLIVVKHRRGRRAAKFVNVAVLEGDRIKVIDENASALPDCPSLLSTLLGFDAVDAVAGLTAVDGATLMTSTYDVLAFGAKIVRRRGQPQVEQMTVTEPVESDTPAVINPTTFGGTRHLSAAQFVHDQRDSVALVAGQDGRFTVFVWSPCIDMVHAHRVETLLL